MTADPSRGNAATILLLASIKRDPSLQCRLALNEEAVARYVDVVDELPPVRVLEVDGEAYLVDGWHRYEAHARAGRTTIHAFVEQGTRRDAVLCAVRANSDHGLPRTQEDTRRAVKVLLQDPEWCKLSDRKLAGFAAVSHTHVANLRRHYGVKAGVLLTDAEANRLDGKMSPEWEAIAKGMADYERKDFDAVRGARTPAELAKIVPESWNTRIVKAKALRGRELAVEPWPWADETNEAGRAALLARLDTADELLAAAGSIALDDAQRELCYKLLAGLKDIERKLQPWQYSEYAKAWSGRPAMVARALERKAEREAEEAAKPKSSWDETREIYAEKNLLTQSKLVGACSKEAFANIDPRELLPVVRDGNYKLRAERGGDWEADPKPVDLCVVPGCQGWIKPSQHSYNRTCVVCREQPDSWKNGTKKALANVATLLDHEGYGFVVDGVIIDARTIAALKAIKANPSGAVKLAGELGKAVRSLLTQAEPSVILVDPKAKPPAEPDEEFEVSEYSDEELAREIGVRAFAAGEKLQSPPTWLPEALRATWKEGWSLAAAQGQDADEELDAEVEEAEAVWREEAGEGEEE